MERKYEDMSARLGRLYDENAEIKAVLDNTLQKVEAVKQGKLTADYVHEQTDGFADEFESLSNEEKKVRIASIVERVGIDSDACPKDGDVVVSKIRFKVPVELGVAPKADGKLVVGGVREWSPTVNDMEAYVRNLQEMIEVDKKAAEDSRVSENTDERSRARVF